MVQASVMGSDLAASVAAATELGLLATAQPEPGEHDAALELLDRVVRSDASTLHTVVDGDLACTEVGVRHYPEPARRALAGPFLRGPHMEQVIGAPLPPSISTEPGQRFRTGELFTTQLAPHGFRDGMSAELRHRRRRVGFVHLSATDECFDRTAQQLLASVLPALARLLDPQARLAVEPRLPEGSAAAVLTGDAAVEVDGHPLPELLGEEEFRDVVRALHHGGARRDRGHDPHDRRLAGLWPTRDGWCSFVVQPVGPRHEGRVLLHTLEVEPPHHLTARELEVLTCVAVGLTNAQVAGTLGISARTVHTHVDSVLRKTGCANRAAAAALARRDGLVRPLRQLDGYGVVQLAVSG
ncbi:helix-turn-helix transcriptional regulator [Nocardioides caldifontis]|uniref:helix-turn-helix transcriptional regulator n=1 Tax=Nocardioides caldifontis TaxID=2588938 RepID=UPI0011E0105D|nr:LuxR family transcriptional regulator [Nocardioides caldifontis]